jgi:hypothetical protein
MAPGGSARHSLVVPACVGALLTCVGPLRAQELPQAAFGHETELSTNEGHVLLQWGHDDELLIYQLQMAATADFTAPTRLYEGSDKASFLSGLVDGRHFFRVRAREPDSETWGPWSASAEVVCEHHALTTAWAFFAVGGALFVLIVLSVGTGARSVGRFARNNG